MSDPRSNCCNSRLVYYDCHTRRYEDWDGRKLGPLTDLRCKRCNREVEVSKEEREE